MELIALIGLLIEVAITAASAAGDANSAAQYRRQASALSDLRSRISSEDKIDLNTINKLNSIISSLENVRYQLDPRLVSKIDKAIDTANRAMTTTNTRIQNRADQYESAVASSESYASGLAGLIERSTTADKIKKMEVEPAQNFEQTIEGGDIHVSKKE